MKNENMIKKYQNMVDNGKLLNHFIDNGFIVSENKFKTTSDISIIRYINKNSNIFYEFLLKWNKQELKWKIKEVTQGIIQGIEEGK